MVASVPSVLIDRCALDPAHQAVVEDGWDFVLRGLERESRIIVVLHLRHGMTFAEIGVALGYDRSQASRVFAAAIISMRASGKAEELRG